MKKSKRSPRRRASGAAGPPRRWSQERRLEFIDFRLRWDGRLNRRDITEFFGISVPQASLDIARYSELAPKNLDYDRGSRTYLATREFRSLYAASSPRAFLDELLDHATRAEPERTRLGLLPPIAVAPVPARSVNADVLVALQRAIHERRGLSVTYQSLTRPHPGRRTLSPHAFVYDGQRWHVRAYCHSRHAFRDFVLARILEVHGPAPLGLGPAHDTSWNVSVELMLEPNPALPPAQRRAIELDYGMVNGQVVLACREALLFYVLERLRVGPDARGAPEAQQIVLTNAHALEARWKELRTRRVA